DVLVLSQDHAMERRCAIAYVHLYPAANPRKADKPTIPLLATIDGFPGNNGVIPFDQMQTEELQFGDTHVTELCHGTDISGLAQYTTRLPGHRYPAEEKIEEVFVGSEYYPWVVQQLLNYERGGHCLLRD